MKEDDLMKLAAAAAVPGTVGGVMGVLRAVFVDRHGGWWPRMRAILAAVLVAVIADFALMGESMPELRRMAIVAVAAVLGDDLVLATLAFGKMLGLDPVGALGRVWAAFKGRKPGE